ncbi:MAG TPA: SDR family NAD(P)-dependent oxidoreductase, partial [Puia sp.]|nr:SDR family NAD(P)-dependent oxidoreductase [Puia sp.]
MKKQTILITGASSGIGKAAALLLQRKGHTVFAAARQVDKMKELKETGVQILSMDVTREDSMKTAVQSIFNQAGTIDVLVNNAGYGSYGALEDVPLSEARYQF